MNSRKIRQSRRFSYNFYHTIYLSHKFFQQYIENDRRNPDGSFERRAIQPQQMCLGPNYTLGRNMAVQAGVVQIFDRVMSELSLKIKRLDIDQTELAFLKAIIVFNPGEWSNVLKESVKLFVLKLPLAIGRSKQTRSIIISNSCLISMNRCSSSRMPIRHRLASSEDLCMPRWILPNKVSSRGRSLRTTPSSPARPPFH